MCFLLLPISPLSSLSSLSGVSYSNLPPEKNWRRHFNQGSQTAHLRQLLKGPSEAPPLTSEKSQPLHLHREKFLQSNVVATGHCVLPIGGSNLVVVCTLEERLRKPVSSCQCTVEMRQPHVVFGWQLRRERMQKWSLHNKSNNVTTS